MFDSPEQLINRVVVLVSSSKEGRWYVGNVCEDEAYREEFFSLCDERGLVAEVDGRYIKVSNKFVGKKCR